MLGLRCMHTLDKLMTMSPLYPCNKPCSTGTHKETVKKLPYFLHSIDRIRIEQICDKEPGFDDRENYLSPQNQSAVVVMLYLYSLCSIPDPLKRGIWNSSKVCTVSKYSQHRFKLCRQINVTFPSGRRGISVTFYAVFKLCRYQHRFQNSKSVQVGGCKILWCNAMS